MAKKHNKVDVKSLLVKALEDGIKKAVELAIVTAAFGLALKFVLATIPAVMLASVIARVLRFKLN